jgi:hypothetical protein
MFEYDVGSLDEVPRARAIPHSNYSRLRYMGLELNDLRTAFLEGGPEVRALIVKLSGEFEKYVTECANVIISVWHEGTMPALDSADVGAYLSRQLRNSVVTTRAREIIGSDVRGFAHRDFYYCQTARLYLSLIKMRVKGEYSVSTLAKRIATATMIPLSLTSSGYLVYGMTVGLLSFFKEEIYDKANKGFGTEGTLGELCNRYRSGHQFEDGQHGFKRPILALVKARPIELTLEEFATHAGEAGWTHVIQLGDNRYACLDPLISATLGVLRANEVGFIYDSRFVLLVSKGAEPGGEVIALRASARASRVVPHPKNVKHVTLVHNGTELSATTSHAVSGGFMRSLVDYARALVASADRN